MEFLPTDKIDNELIDLFGISSKEEQEEEELCVDGECRKSIFDQLAVFAIVAFAIFIFCLLLAFLRILVMCCPKV